MEKKNYLQSDYICGKVLDFVQNHLFPVLPVQGPLGTVTVQTPTKKKQFRAHWEPYRPLQTTVQGPLGTVTVQTPTNNSSGPTGDINRTDPHKQQFRAHWGQ